MPFDSTTILQRIPLFEEQKHAETTSIQLSEMMQAALLRLERERRRVKLIIRCSDLPYVKGNYQAWTSLFEDLLRTIIANPTEGRHLFLHIDCAKVDEVDGYNGIRNSFHQLQFFTNVQAGESWYSTNRNTIEACRTAFEKLQAKLLLNVAGGNNCLYMINIPVQQ